MRKTIWILMALSMLLLSACGGDSLSDTQQETESFVSMMGAVTLTEIAEVSPVPIGAETALDWAEHKFPDLFPKYNRDRYPTIGYEGKVFNARAYTVEEGTRWLAVDSNQNLFGLGDYTGNTLTSFENINHWSDQIIKDLFTVTVDDQFASKVEPTDYYHVRTRDAAFGYPESYLETATTQEDISIYPCQLEVETVAYPKSWLGNFPLPEVKNPPLASSISRGVIIKDIMLPDNPTFIGGCSGDLNQEFERSFDRLVDLGVDYVQVTQWHWAGIRDDGTWYVFDVGDSYGGLSDASVESFVSAAHSRGLKVIMFNQVQAVSDGPGNVYVPDATLENYQKWLDAFGPFMRSRAAYFESIGIDLWEMGCSPCMYWDSGDGSPAAGELFSNAYATIIDEVKTQFTGSTFLSMTSWLSDRPDILDKVDYVSVGMWAPEINPIPDSFDASEYRDNLLNGGWSFGMQEIDNLGKPIIINFGVQSRSNAFSIPGYIEETGCTASLDIFDTAPDLCIQREIQPDFSLQAIVIEGSFEAIQALELENLGMVMIGDYWATDSMYSKDLFPNLGTTFRNKPAEGIIYQWFAQP